MRTDLILTTSDDSYYYFVVRETFPRLWTMAFWWEHVGRHLYGAPALSDIVPIDPVKSQG